MARRDCYWRGCVGDRGGVAVAGNNSERRQLAAGGAKFPWWVASGGSAAVVCFVRRRTERNVLDFGRSGHAVHARRIGGVRAWVGDDCVWGGELLFQHAFMMAKSRRLKYKGARWYVLTEFGRVPGVGCERQSCARVAAVAGGF